MPVHKMITIDGIRVRPEDADRYRPAMEPKTAAAAEPFDPAAATAEQVLTYLGTVGAAEAARVLDAEAIGKNRVGVTSKREQLLAAAAERDGGTGGAAT